MNLNNDPRWQRFNNNARVCPCCSQSYNGVFDIGYDHPDPWPHGNRQNAAVDILMVGDDRLGTDFCELGPHRFIRCVLQIPIIGTAQYFAFGPWGSVKPENFDAYVASESDHGSPNFEGCFAWLVNDLPGFEMEDWLPCNLIPGDDDQRPSLEIHDNSHEIARLQSDGITFDRLLDIYAAYGQDIRPHLMDA